MVIWDSTLAKSHRVNIEVTVSSKWRDVPADIVVKILSSDDWYTGPTAIEDGGVAINVMELGSQ